MTDDRARHETQEERRLRQLLVEGAVPGTLDTDSVIRRSRSRRRVGAVMTTAVSALAVVGIGAAALGGLGDILPRTSVADAGSSEEATLFGAEGGASDSGMHLAPASKVHPCAAPVSEVAPSMTGLVATPEFEELAAADGTVKHGTVTLSNTGIDTVRGTVPQEPVIALAEDSVTVWHSSETGELPSAVVDLEPGESMRLEANYLPVRCEQEDKTRERLRDDLPPLEPGIYQLRAVIPLTLDDGSAPELITGPAQEITLR
ncbi:MAG: hypothetical protein IR160_02635 [Salinibacterium sp.]|nr:hypothetical protein [Salinibacterium sp.]MBF0671464.1 hypothetical protein [Salinibacterium sp.]